MLVEKKKAESKQKNARCKKRRRQKPGPLDRHAEHWGPNGGNFSAKSLKSLDCQDKSGPATLFHQQTADMTKGMRPRGMKMWFLNGPLLVLAKPRLLNPCFVLPFYVLSNNPAYIHSKKGYTDIPFIHTYCIYVEK